MSSVDPVVRRRPTQQRSRTRFEGILEAASELIAERGLEPTSMTDIANRSGMGLTALYRYFPNKRSIVRELALRTFDDAQSLIGAAAEDETELAPMIDRGVRQYWRMHREQPFRGQLRAAIHADAELTALDLDDSRRNAHAMARTTGQLTGRTDLENLERQILLMIELLDSLMRLVVNVDEAEAEPLVAEFVQLFVDALSPSDGQRAAEVTPPRSG
ncbi:MAG: TetR/AcrR family transcriptional regulator [Actinomycetota bacterium]